MFKLLLKPRFQYKERLKHFFPIIYIYREKMFKSHLLLILEHAIDFKHFVGIAIDFWRFRYKITTFS